MKTIALILCGLILGGCHSMAYARNKEDMAFVRGWNMKDILFTDIDDALEYDRKGRKP